MASSLDSSSAVATRNRRRDTCDGDYGVRFSPLVPLETNKFTTPSPRGRRELSHSRATEDGVERLIEVGPEIDRVFQAHTESQ